MEDRVGSPVEVAIRNEGGEEKRGNTDPVTGT